MVGRTSNWSKATLPPCRRPGSKRRLTTPGICTLGLWMRSEPEKAFQALKNAVRGGGRIVIGDIKLVLWPEVHPESSFQDPANNTSRVAIRTAAWRAAVYSRKRYPLRIYWTQSLNGIWAVAYYIASGRGPMPSE